MSSYALSDRGILRPVNEDSTLIVEKDDCVLAVVCDGIGGNKAGEIASALCCQYLKEEFEKASAPDGAWLSKTIGKINEKVHMDGAQREEYNGMGTTLVCFLHTPTYSAIANVGDSRGYLLNKDNELIQISQDHTMINELVKNRGLDEKTASRIVGKNVINRAIGVYPSVDADIFEIMDYKSVLICSDGLHAYVDEKMIKAVLVSNESLQEKCTKMVELANQAGGYDNISVAIYQED